MTKLEKIERDIATLAPDELARFRAWFAAYDAVQWDTQFETDVEAGRLDQLADNALADLDAGRTRPL